MTIDIDPVIVHLGPIALTWYGVFVLGGIVAGVALALREARRRGIPTEHGVDLACWIVAGGLVGGRLLHVLDWWDFYAADPMRVVALNQGGLAIAGAVLGGTLAGVFAARRYRLPIRGLSDAAAPGAILGQAIGRLGCLVNGDALGPATDGFGVRYLHPGTLAPALGVTYVPTFLYEGLGDLAILGILLLARHRVRAPGALFALYLALYGALKFAITFLRTERVVVLGLQEAQLLALAAIALAAIWVAWPRRRGSEAPA